MKVNNFRVRQRIMAALLLIAALASVSGIVSVILLGNVQKDYHQGLEHYGFAQGSVGIVMTSAAQLDREVHDSIGFIDADYRDEVRGIVEQLYCACEQPQQGNCWCDFRKRLCQGKPCAE